MKFEYMRVSEFFKDAKRTTIEEDVRRKLEREREQEGPIDLYLLRMRQDWSYLSNRVVGGEERNYK